MHGTFTAQRLLVLAAHMPFPPALSPMGAEGILQRLREPFWGHCLAPLMQGQFPAPCLSVSSLREVTVSVSPTRLRALLVLPR